MSLPLGIEFFRRATDMGAISGDTSMSDMLEAWSIDLEAFLSWLIVYRQSVDNRMLDPEENVSCALVAGFETGYRARMAVEEATA